MKHVVAIILALALLVESVAFIGVAVGTGAAAVVGPPKLTNTCSGPGGIEFCVNFTTSGSLGGTFVSNWKDGISTPITFYVSGTTGLSGQSNSGCGDSNPGWYEGYGQDPGYLEVQIIDSVTGQPVSLLSQSLVNWSAGSDGTVTQTSTAFYVSYNQTTNVGAYCYGAPQDSAPHFIPWAPTTFTLVGQFDDFSILEVQFVTKGHFCGGFGHAAACDQGSPNPFQQSTGNWYVDAIGETYLRNGGGYFTWNGQTLYNGEHFTITGATGYDAGQGFQILFEYPAVRGGGTIASTVIPDDQASFGASFTVPANASQNSSNQLYNQFQLAMYSPVAQYTYAVIPIDISPAEAPPSPSISVQDLENHDPIQVGDQLSVAISASGTLKPLQAVTTIILWAWYLTPTTSANGLPATGSGAWISPGGQSGDSLPTSLSGINGTALYEFDITQPYSFVIQVESITNLSQTSKSQVSETLYVQPPSCSGTSCMSTHGSSLWALLGPIILSSIIVTVSLLAAVFLPMVWKVVVVAGGIALVTVLYVFGVFANTFGTHMVG